MAAGSRTALPSADDPTRSVAGQRGPPATAFAGFEPLLDGSVITRRAWRSGRLSTVNFLDPEPGMAAPHQTGSGTPKRRTISYIQMYIKYLDDVTTCSISIRYVMGVRRERDSNPRYGFPHTRTPSVRLRPLGHPSGTVQRSDSHDPLNRQSGRQRRTVFHRPPMSGLNSEQPWLVPRCGGFRGFAPVSATGQLAKPRRTARSVGWTLPCRVRIVFPRPGRQRSTCSRPTSPAG